MKSKFCAAGLIILFGLGSAMESLDYRLGTLKRMGPGYYPLLLSGLLILLGLMVALLPETDEGGEGHVAAKPMASYIRPWCCILGGILAFIVLGKYGGLIPATFALLFLATLGDANNSIRSSFWMALGGIVFAVVVFHYAMQIQFPLFRLG